jgi:hypothetical protein
MKTTDVSNLYPSIVSARVWNWRGHSTSSRRYYERRNLQIVETFLKNAGFNVEYANSNTIHATLDEIEVTFHYSESCSNVYKTFSVFITGRRSNIVGLTKALRAKGIAKECTNCAKEFIDATDTLCFDCLTKDAFDN